MKRCKLQPRSSFLCITLSRPNIARIKIHHEAVPTKVRPLSRNTSPSLVKDIEETLLPAPIRRTTAASTTGGHKEDTRRKKEGRSADSKVDWRLGSTEERTSSPPIRRGHVANPVSSSLRVFPSTSNQAATPRVATGKSLLVGHDYPPRRIDPGFPSRREREGRLRLPRTKAEGASIKVVTSCTARGATPSTREPRKHLTSYASQAPGDGNTRDPPQRQRAHSARSQRPWRVRSDIDRYRRWQLLRRSPSGSSCALLAMLRRSWLGILQVADRHRRGEHRPARHDRGGRRRGLHHRRTKPPVLPCSSRGNARSLPARLRGATTRR